MISIDVVYAIISGFTAPYPAQITANMSAAANMLQEAISMSGEDRSRQRVESLLTNLNKVQRASRTKNSSGSNA